MPPGAENEEPNIENCDVLVIGGGIAGCGVARDLSLRGLRVVVVEKNDFGSGTTGRSTRIVHGGLRYLQNLEFGLVREGLRERAVLMKVAGHLVKPLKFVIPMYSGSSPGRWRTKLGLVAYDLLAGGGGLPRHRFLNSAEARRLVPSIKTEGLDGAYLYHDAQVEMVERLCLESLISVEKAGGGVHNHCEAFRTIRRGNRIFEVRLRERTREWGVRPKFVVNATGPWIDEFLSTMFGQEKKKLITTKGVHLVLDRRISEEAVVVSSGGRLLFAVPWLHGTLVGTTDTLHTGSPDSVEVGEEDIRYLVDSVSQYLPEIGDEYVASYAGLRPLVAKGIDDPSKISRAYSMIDHATDGVDNMVTLAGVKITEFRGAAEKTSDFVCRKIGVRAGCRTRDELYPGAGGDGGHVEDERLSPEELEHLVALYGSRVGDVLDEAGNDDALLKRICPHNPDLVLEVGFAVRHEHAKTVSDFMFRRSYLAYSSCKGVDGLDTVTDIMGGMLSWNEEEKKSNADEYIRDAMTGASERATGRGLR